MPSRNSLPLILTAVVCLLSGGAIGYGLGRRPSIVGPAVGGITHGPDPGVVDPVGFASSSTSEEGPGPKPVQGPSKGRVLTASELQVALKDLARQRSGFWGMGGAKELARLQEQLEGQDLEELLRQLAALPGGHEMETAWFLVLSQLAQRDPEAAWAQLLQLPPGNRRNSATVSVLATVAQRDASRAMAMAKGVSDPSLQRSAIQQVLGLLASQDPARAFELALAEPPQGGRSGDNGFSSIFHAWAGKDPEAAKAALGRLTGQGRDQAMQAFVSGYAAKDPKAAWDWVRTLPHTGEEWRDPRLMLIQTWAATDPQSALEAARSLAPGSVRTRATTAAIGNWAGRDFGAAFDFVLAMPESPERSEALANIAGNAPDRPRMLQALIEQMPPGDRFQNAVRNLFSQWASNDPAAAAAAFAQIPAGSLSSGLAGQIAQQWGQSADRAAGFQWVRQLPAGETRQNALSSFFGAWANDLPEEAIRAALALPAAEQRPAVSSAARGWASRDPEAVVRWAQSVGDDTIRRDVVDNALGVWAQRSPAEAAAWVSRLPMAQRERPLSVLVDRWAAADLPAAAEWLNAQPATPDRDAAVETLVRRLGDEDPEAAIAWAGSISEAARRTRQIEEAARRWIRYSPEAARVWISSSQALTPEARERLLKAR